MANYLDLTGLQRLWGRAKGKFVAQPAEVTDGQIATFTSSTETINGTSVTVIGIQDSGFTIGTSVPSGAVFTDYQATSAGHYVPAAADGSAITPTANNTNLAWEAAVITGISKDNNGHITGVTTTKLPANPVSANTVEAAANLPNDEVILGAGNKGVKTSGYTLGGATFSSAVSGTDVILATEAGVKDYVDDAVAGLAGAMHFVGTTAAAMTDLQTTNPTVTGVSTFAAGDVVIDSTETEFVLGKDSKWHKLGDANSYALANNVVNSWTGAGDEDGIITVTPNTATNGAVSASILHKNNYSANSNKGSSTKVAQISNDKYGHVTGITEVDIAFPVTSVAGKTGAVDLDDFTFGTKAASNGAASGSISYDGSAAKGLYFSSAAASGTNVQFDIDENGFVTGTISPAAAGNGALQIQGTTGNATATGFTANSTVAGTIVFAKSGDAISSITTSGGTVTINSASTLPNPNALTVTTGAYSGTAGDLADGYNGSAAKTLTFDNTTAAAPANASSTGNVQFTVTTDGHIKGEFKLPANAFENDNTYTTGVAYTQNASTGNVVATWTRTAPNSTYGGDTDMPVAYGATADSAISNADIDSACQ